MTNEERRDNLYAWLDNLDGWFTLEELLTFLPMSYPVNWARCKNITNSRARRLMTEDIAAINSDPRYEKIIIHGNNGVKIATEEEAARFFSARKAELARSFRSLREIGRKIGLDGQIDLDGEVVEAFAGE